MHKLALVVIACLALPAHATTARFVNLPELVRSADTVLVARSVGQSSFWQGTRIFTLVHLEVEEVWTGNAPSRVDVLTPGGIVDGIGQRVDGAAQMPVGKRVVTHLHREVTGEYTPIAMAQGVWWVQQTEAGALTVARAHVDRLMGAPAGHKMPATLAELKQAVLEAAHAP